MKAAKIALTARRRRNQEQFDLGRMTVEERRTVFVRIAAEMLT